MESDSPMLETSETNDSLIVDQTVTYMIIAIGVILAFLLMMSTFGQVDRFTAEPSHLAPSSDSLTAPEIGG